MRIRKAKLNESKEISKLRRETLKKSFIPLTPNTNEASFIDPACCLNAL